MNFIENYNKSKEEKEIEQRLDTIIEKPMDRFRLKILKSFKKR